jgi:ribonuclease R
MNFGSADSAASCMTARIMEQGIPVEFSDEALREAEKAASVGVTEFDVGERLDLRGETVFTIDGAASKDLDDAVSVRRHPDGGWELGVHIADVSHYVRQGSALDAEGFERGTSIYYADKVIPMLPPALSNGICSLNQGVDRLTISAVMHLSPEGELLESRFSKSVTRSVIRGVYSECNAVLDGTASTEIAEKYAPAAESLHLLSELTDVLEKRRRQRGAPELESAEAALKLNENGQCIGLSPIERGRSECIIEACMLAANEAAARLAREKDFPLVYRIHEHPDPARIVRLKEAVVKLGMNPPRFEAEQTSPENIRQLLENAKQTSGFQIVNMLTLRAMAKARYSSEPTGHFGLALRDYAHFTSPIRRYPDLAVHRILSDYLEGADSRWLQKRYGKFAENAASHSSDMELRAVSVERDADSCYAAEFMQSHIGERFHGIITGVTDFGIYVTLDNFAEGLLHIHDLPEGSYDYEEGWYLRDSVSGREYRLGGELEVICTRADISSGHIDLGQSSTMTA